MRQHSQRKAHLAEIRNSALQFEHLHSAITIA